MITDARLEFGEIRPVGTQNFYISDVLRFKQVRDLVYGSSFRWDIELEVTEAFAGANARMQFGFSYGEDSTLAVSYALGLCGGILAQPWLSASALSLGTRFRIPLPGHDFLYSGGLANDPDGRTRFCGVVAYNVQRVYASTATDFTQGTVNAALVANMPTPGRRHYDDGAN